MKWISLFLLCFLSNLVMSQLIVKGDNYVFATTNIADDDVYIFVKDEINLKDANSQMYLRNNAQLLQGSETSRNAGIGKLSIYQSGTVNNFAYNYWCSPVGNIDSDNSENRNFRANNQLYTPTGLIQSNLAQYSTGLDGTYSNPYLTIASRWLASFNSGTSYNNWNVIASVGEVATGYGFSMKGTVQGDQLYDFRGKPNTGTISTAVLANNFTLVGNPYPSALDARAYIWDTNNKANMTGTLYYWDQDKTVNSHILLDYVGGYASYTISENGLTETFVPATYSTYSYDGTNTTANSGGAESTSLKKASRYIPVGQGFMITGKANGFVQTKNSHRSYVKQSFGKSEFFRLKKPKLKNKETSFTTNPEYTADGFNIINEEYKRFRIGVDFNNLYTRELVQTFNENATDGFDRGLESESNIISNDAFWISQGIPYVAQAFKFRESLRIPLAINLKVGQPLQVKIFDIQNFDSSQKIYLHDKVTNLYTDLTKQNFQISLNAGYYKDRLSIVFVTENTLGTNDELFDKGILVFMKNSTSEIQIKNNSEAALTDVKLYNNLGQLHQVWLRGLDDSNIILHVNKISTGIYIVKINTTKGVVSKKVIIQ